MIEPRTIEVPADGDDAALVVDHYSPEGDALGCVIHVHGFAGGRTSVKGAAIGRALAARGHTFLAVDLQGHGDSGGAFRELTIGRSIRDVRRVAALPEYRDADARGLSGSSFGGLVTAWALAEDPALAQRAFLIAPAIGFLDRYIEFLGPDKVSAWRAGSSHRVEHGDDVHELAPDILLENDTRTVATLADGLRTPTVIVHGDRDTSIPIDASRDFVAGAAHADAVTLIEKPGADHRFLEHLPWVADAAATQFAGPR